LCVCVHFVVAVCGWGQGEGNWVITYYLLTSHSQSLANIFSHTCLCHQLCVSPTHTQLYRSTGSVTLPLAKMLVTQALFYHYLSHHLALLTLSLSLSFWGARGSGDYWLRLVEGEKSIRSKAHTKPVSNQLSQCFSRQGCVGSSVH
jgi:hypothetical protein